MTNTVQLLVLALVALGGVLCSPDDGPHFVSLEDVTGTTANPVQSVNPPLNLVRPGGVVRLEDVTGVSSGVQGGDYRSPRPGGTVSLEDVTGVQHTGHEGSRPLLPPPPPPRPHPGHPHPGHHNQYDPAYDYYRPYSPCEAPMPFLYKHQQRPHGQDLLAPPPSVNVVPLSDVTPPPVVRRRRSPSPKPYGEVALSDVTGHRPYGYYGGYQPYVRPGYSSYNNYWYSRPRPYYYNVIPCIGLWCL